MNCKVTREQVEDLKNFHMGIDVVQALEAQLIKELTENISENIRVRIQTIRSYDYPELKKYKQVFNEVDPYGEEMWEE
jgi:hypothetical protein